MASAIPLAIGMTRVSQLEPSAPMFARPTLALGSTFATVSETATYSSTYFALLSFQWPGRVLGSVPTLNQKPDARSSP